MKRYFHFAGVTIALIAVLLSCQKSGTKQDVVQADSVAAAPAQPVMNALTAEEKAAGWELLFDGTSFAGWKRYNHDSIGPLWTIHDGVIVCDGKGLTEGTKDSKDTGGSLMTTRQFGNFELVADWKLSPGGNSGILYHVVENKKYQHDYETGPEYQVMDDGGWKDKLNEAQKVGSNYDMFPAPANKKVNPVGEWNTAKIVYNNGHVEHWLNGEKTVEFEEGSAPYKEAFKKSKWVKYPDWNKSRVGAISLQDHGAPVYFRNIKIHVLQ